MKLAVTIEIITIRHTDQVYNNSRNCTLQIYLALIVLKYKSFFLKFFINVYF